MYQQGQEITVLADNENDIFTEQSKQDQYENPDIDGYSRWYNENADIWIDGMTDEVVKDSTYQKISWPKRKESPKHLLCYDLTGVFVLKK